jgi:uncharacterized membrane protein
MRCVMSVEHGIKPIRLTALDATRGIAMLLVCLSHFAGSYLPPDHAAARHISFLVGMIASPTFVVISGVMLGYLVCTSGPASGRLRAKLGQRGLCYLVAGHFLIAAAYVGSTPRPPWAAVFITDSIGAAMLAGPAIVMATAPWIRLGLALALLAASCVVSSMWAPRPLALVLVKAIAVGEVGPGNPLWYAFPFVPWFSVYLAGTVLGERLGGVRKLAEDEARGGSLLAVTGALAACTAVATVLAQRLLPSVRTVLAPTASGEHWFSAYQKVPPGPVYLGFFGGIGLMCAACLMAWHRGLLPPVRKLVGPIGRSSFFVFVLQYYVYIFALPRMRLAYTPLWPLYYLASVVGIWACAVWWDRHHCNRFLTFPALWRALSGSAPPSVSAHR